MDLRTALGKGVARTPSRPHVWLLNMAAWVEGRATRWKRVNRFLEAHESGLSITYAHRSRSLLYWLGVARRLESLAEEYGVKSLTAEEPGLVIDCGANVGEFAMWVAENWPGMRVVGFEPEARERACFARNLSQFRDSNWQLFENPLWSADETIPWLSNPESADSGVVVDQKCQWERKIARSIDSVWINDFRQCKIFLMKIEAEGAEPEVLQGASRALQRTVYVTVDVGPERGKFAQETGKQVSEIMFQSGFDLIWRSPNGKRKCLLFVNRTYILSMV